MEDWEKDFEWLKIRNEVKDSLGLDKLPDLNVMLVLIGVQELGQLPPDPMPKEYKQDLMHVAVCTLLAPQGIFEYEGKDEEGWPHYRQVRAIEVQGEKAQENMLIQQIIQYFKQMEVS